MAGAADIADTADADVAMLLLPLAIAAVWLLLLLSSKLGSLSSLMGKYYG